MKKLLSTVAAAAILSGSAFAASSTNHVAVAPNGLGDALIFQEYFAMSGWDTHLKVINTDINNAVVARVAVYESSDSQEVRDFYIYLSPGDVWTADLKLSAAGTPSIVSTDDSTYRGPSATDGSPTFASEAVPMEVSLNGAAAGYVNVVAVAAKSGTDLAGAGWLAGQPISKTVIYNNFHNVSTDWKYPKVDVLTGTEIVKDTNNNRAMALPAVAIKNLLGDSDAQTKQVANGPVRIAQISGAFQPTAALTGLTIFSNTAFGLAANTNSLAELDAALSRGASVIPFETNGDAPAPSIVNINFPTENLLEETGAYKALVATGAQAADISYTLSTDIRNESEVNVKGVFSPVTAAVLGKEINQLVVSDLVKNAVAVVPSLSVSDFKAGWLSLNLTPNVTSYNTTGILNTAGDTTDTVSVTARVGTAAPALVNVMSASNVGSDTRLNWMNSPFYETSLSNSTGGAYSKYEFDK
jgi:hypothetical protein